MCPFQIGEDPSVIAAVRNSPRFAIFVIEDGGSMYFLFVEQITVCESSTAGFEFIVFPSTLHNDLSQIFKNLCLACHQQQGNDLHHI